jgi:hypothetical protein
MPVDVLNGIIRVPPVPSVTNRYSPLDTEATAICEGAAGTVDVGAVMVYVPVYDWLLEFTAERAPVLELIENSQTVTKFAVATPSRANSQFPSGETANETTSKIPEMAGLPWGLLNEANAPVDEIE